MNWKFFSENELPFKFILASCDTIVNSPLKKKKLLRKMYKSHREKRLKISFFLDKMKKIPPSWALVIFFSKRIDYYIIYKNKVNFFGEKILMRKSEFFPSFLRMRIFFWKIQLTYRLYFNTSWCRSWSTFRKIISSTHQGNFFLFYL